MIGSKNANIEPLVGFSERSRPPSNHCDLCGQEVSADKRRKHIGRHMQELALFVLPNTRDADEENQNMRMGSIIEKKQKRAPLGTSTPGHGNEPLPPSQLTLTTGIEIIGLVLSAFSQLIQNLNQYISATENSQYKGELELFIQEIALEKSKFTITWYKVMNFAGIPAGGPLWSPSYEWKLLDSLRPTIQTRNSFISVCIEVNAILQEFIKKFTASKDYTLVSKNIPMA